MATLCGDPLHKTTATQCGGWGIFQFFEKTEGIYEFIYLFEGIKKIGVHYAKFQY